MAAIQLLDAPLEAQHKDFPILVLGFFIEDIRMKALCVDDGGTFTTVDAADLKVAWRYDWQKRVWTDGGVDDSET